MVLSHNICYTFACLGGVIFWVVSVCLHHVTGLVVIAYCTSHRDLRQVKDL